jgi:hypothetical protein
MISSLLKERIKRTLGNNTNILRLADRGDVYIRSIECSECGRLKPLWRISIRQEDYWFCNEECIGNYFPENDDSDAMTLSELRTELFGPTVGFSNRFSAELGWLNRDRFGNNDF